MTLSCVRGRRLLAWVVGAAVSFGVALPFGVAQGQQSALPASAQAVLLEMAGRAGVIFTGEVVGVTREDASGYVDVKFRVDQPVRGVSKNGAYVLREWAGLWVSGPERYRVGQRFLMLLTARGSSGMSAPVGGTDGAIPLLAGVDEPLFRGNGDAPVDKATDAPEAQVDLRWLAARAVRTVVGSGSAVRKGSLRPRVGAAAISPAAGEGAGAAGTGVRTALAGGGRTIAATIEEPGQDGESAPAEGWVGAVAPLANAGVMAVQANAYSAATKLSSVLGLLTTSSGSAHVAR